MIKKRLDGYYDETGKWIKLKYCLIYCGPEKCTCTPPMGKYQIEPRKESPTVETDQTSWGPNKTGYLDY